MDLRDGADRAEPVAGTPADTIYIMVEIGVDDRLDKREFNPASCCGIVPPTNRRPPGSCWPVAARKRATPRWRCTQERESTST